MTYVISGLCCGLAGFLIACRLSGAGPGTGAGLEIAALTAAVVGGNSLGGGRGSIAKGTDGRHHRAGDDQRTHPSRLRHRLQSDGAGPAAGRRRDARHPLAEEPPQGAGRGLCDADPSPHGRGAIRAARLRQPLCARQPARRDRVHRPRRAGGAGGRHARPRRSPLLRHAPRRDRPLLRPGLQTLGGLRPYRRLPARPRLRPRRQSHLLRRRDGTLFDLQDRRGDQALGRDQALLDLHRRRCAAARSQRLRHRAGRADLLHRFHDALRRPRMGAGFDREPADRTPALLRPEDRQDHDRPRQAALCQRRLHGA